MKINAAVSMLALAQLLLPGQLMLANSANAASPLSRTSSSPTPSHVGTVNLDLTSRSASLSAAKVAANQSLTIRVGGIKETVTTASMLTPAEMAAAYQVAKTGLQTLVIGTGGAAVGGTLSVGNTLSKLLANLVVPKNVKILDTVGSLTLSGDLTNSGKIIFTGSSQLTQASLNANDIYNYGSISSVVSLALNASGSIVNAGSITTSKGDLTLAANSITNNTNALVQAANNLNLISGNITNAATVAALAGNLNINTLLPMNIVVNNAGGTLKALLGDVNVRNATFSGQNNVDINGGNVFSQNLNLYSGSGAVNANLNQVSSMVNVYAGEAHVIAATNDLMLGTMDISGDPSFYNTAGAVTINGSLTFPGQALAIVALTNITSSATGSLNTSSSSTTGGAITLIAGAAFTAKPSNTSSATTSAQGGGNGDSANTLTITGGAKAGGYIDLTGGTGTGGGATPITLNSTSTSTTAGSQNGGDTILVAYGGSGANAGTINLPVIATAIQTSGNGSGVNGNVIMIAGSTISGATAINIGGITATGGSGGGGVVSLNTATPTITGGSHNISILNGAIQAGSGSFTAGATKLTSVTTNNNISANQISINAGGNISWFNSIGNFFGPFTIAINPAGTIAYVTNFGSNNFTPVGNTVSVINLATDTVIATIKVGTMPAGVAFSPSGTFAYVTNYNDPSTAPSFIGVPGPGTVSVIDTATNTVTGTIPVGMGAASVVFNPSGTTAYVANYLSNTVSVINTATNTVTSTIAVGFQPTCVAINPAGTAVYVTNTSTTSTNPVGTVSVISAATNTVSTTISGFNTPFAVAFNPSGTVAYVTNSGAGPGQNTVAVVDTATNTISTNITGGGLNGPSAVAFNPSGTLAYVSNYGLPGVDILGNTVSVINTTTNKVTSTLAVGTGPVAIAFNLTGTKAYVADYKYGLKNDGTLGIINVNSPPAVLKAAGPVILKAGSAGSGSIIAYTQTSSLTANAVGDVTVFNNGPVTLAANNGLHNEAKGFYQLNTIPNVNGDGAITVNDTVKATANTTNGIVGNIFLQSSEGSTMGTGGITQTASALLSTSALTVSDSSDGADPGTGTGSIGSNVQNITINAKSLVANTFGNVYIFDSTSTTITAPSTGAIFQLTTKSADITTAPSAFGGPPGSISGTTSVTLSTTTSGNIILNGTVTSPEQITLSTEGGGGIAIGTNVTSSAGAIVITAAGSGKITQPGGSVNANTMLTLASGSGTIGTTNQNIFADAPIVTATTSGDVFIQDTDSSGVILDASSAGTSRTFQFVSSGALTVGAVSAGIISLQTALGSAASMTLVDNVGMSTTSSVNVKADGTGNIKQSAGTVSGAAVTLTSGSGNIEGTVGNLTMLSRSIAVNTGGSALLTNLAIAEAKLSGSTVGGTLQFMTAGALTTSGTVSAGVIELTTTAGNSRINVTGTLGQGDATIDLTASGSGPIATAGPGNILGDAFSFISGSGNITVNTVSTAELASSVSATNGGKGTIAITNAGALTLVNSSTSGGNFTLKTTGAGNALGVASGATVTAGGNLSLTAAGGDMTVDSGSSLTASNGNLLLNNSNQTSGTIEIQSTAALTATSTKASSGNVTISIGSANPAKTNTITPANITRMVTAGGLIFYGANSITSNGAGGNNVLTANARTTTFSTGTAPSSSITLDGNSAITAQVGSAHDGELNNDAVVDTGDDGQDKVLSEY